MAAQVVRNAEEAAVMRRLAEGVREEMMVAMLETLQAAAAACADVCVERLWSLHQGMTRAVEEAEAQQHLAKQPAELLRQRTSLLELLEGSRMEGMEGCAASVASAMSATLTAKPIVGTGGGSPAAVLQKPPQPRDGEISISSDTEEEARSDDHEVLTAVRKAQGLHGAEQLETSEPAAAQDDVIQDIAITQAEEYCMADPAEVVRGSCEAMYEDDWTIMSPSQPSEVSVSPPKGLEGARAACRARRDSRRSAKSDAGSNSPQRNSPQRLSRNTPSRLSLAGFAAEAEAGTEVGAEAGADEPSEEQRAQGSLEVQEAGPEDKKSQGVQESAPERVQDEEEVEEVRPLVRALDTELVNSSPEKVSDTTAATADITHTASHLAPSDAKAPQQLPEEPVAGPCSLDSKGFSADPEEPTSRPASPASVPLKGIPARLETEFELPDAAGPEEREHSAAALPPAQTEDFPTQAVRSCVAGEAEAQGSTRGVVVEAAEAGEAEFPAKSAEALPTAAAELPNGTTGARLEPGPTEALALAPEEPLQPPNPGTEVLSDGPKDEDTTASPSPSPSPSPVEPSCQESESELPREVLEAELVEPMETTEVQEVSETGGTAAANGLASVVATSHESADQQLEEVVRVPPTEPALLPPEAGSQFSRKSLSHSTDEVRLRAEDIVGDEASQAAMEVEFEAATQRIAERKRMSSVLEAGENGAKRPTEAIAVGESSSASDTKASSGEKQDDASRQLPLAPEVEAEGEAEAEAEAEEEQKGASTPPISVTRDEVTAGLPEPAEPHISVQEENVSREVDEGSLVHPVQQQPEATEEAPEVTEELRPDGAAGSQEVVAPPQFAEAGGEAAVAALEGQKSTTDDGGKNIGELTDGAQPHTTLAATRSEEADSLDNGHLAAAAGRVGDNPLPGPSSLENSKLTPADAPVSADVEAREETLHKKFSDNGEHALLPEEPLPPTEAGAAERAAMTAPPVSEPGVDNVSPADIEPTTLAATRKQQELPESAATPPPSNTGVSAAADQELDEASDPARGSEHGAPSETPAGCQSSPTPAAEEVAAAKDDRATPVADDIRGVTSMAAPLDPSEVSGECPLEPVEERNPCALETPPVERVVHSQAVGPRPNEETPGSLPVSVSVMVEPEPETAQGEMSCRQDRAAVDIQLEPSEPLRGEAPNDESPNNGGLAEAVPQRLGSAPAAPAESLALKPQSVPPTEGQSVQGAPAALDDQPEPTGTLGEEVSQGGSPDTGGAAEAVPQRLGSAPAPPAESLALEPQSVPPTEGQSVQGAPAALDDQPEPTGTLGEEVSQGGSPDIGGAAEVMEPQPVTAEREVDFREAPELAEVRPEPPGSVAQDEPASCSSANVEVVETLGAPQASASASARPSLFPDTDPDLGVSTAAAATGAVPDPLWPADPVDHPSSSRPLFELDPQPATAAKSADATARPAQVKSLFDFDFQSDIRVEPPAPVREQTTTPWTPLGGYPPAADEATDDIQL